MNKQETYRNTLAYALTIAGNERELAARLGVGVAQIANWLSGDAEIPDGIFLALVDLLYRSDARYSPASPSPSRTAKTATATAVAIAPPFQPRERTR